MLDRDWRELEVLLQIYQGNITNMSEKVGSLINEEGKIKLMITLKCLSS